MDPLTSAHPAGSASEDATTRTAEERRIDREETLDKSLRLGGALVAVLGALLTWDLLVGTWRAATGQVESLYLWLGAVGAHVFGVDPLGIVALVGLSLVAGIGTIAAGVRTVRATAPVLGMGAAAYWLLGTAPQWWLAAIPLAAYAGLAAAGPLRLYVPGAGDAAREARREPTRVAALLLVAAALVAVAIAQGWLGARPAGLVARVGLIAGALGATVAATRTDEAAPDAIAVGGAVVGAGMVLAGPVASLGGALAVVAALFLAVPDRVRDAVAGVATDRDRRSAPGERPPGLRPGAAFEDRYDVRTRLDADGTGRTLLARDGLVGRDVVLREIAAEDDERVETVLRDAHAADGLDHPRLASLHDVVRSGDRTVLVVEHVPAGSLDDRLRDGPLDRDRALDVADQVLEGLAALHAVGVVHGDLTADDVRFAEDDTVRLTGVGIDRLRGDDEADRDPRADLRAVAALIPRMLTGGAGETGEDDLDDDLAAFLETGLAEDPDDGFADAEAMRDALDELRD